MEILVDDLSGPRIAEFLAAHVAEMHAVSPPGSSHALDLDALRAPGIAFWSALDGGAVAGCGALKALDDGHAEIKSMRTAPTHRNRGVASAILRHVIAEARRMGYTRLSLETGSFDFFAPARGLYIKYGFEYCGPFAGYREDPHSVFMTRTVSAA